MKTAGILSLTVILLFFPIVSFSQTRIIFDTDFGGDADDLGALVMLHNFMDKGECQLLGIMSWSTEKYVVSAIDAINRFYHHDNIPIGTRKDSTYIEEWNYSKPIAEHFPNTLSYDKVPNATILYRQILAESPDTSITIVTVGPLKNIENLLRSDKDSISDLNGKELIERKVREFVMMGGQYPEGEWEWNFSGNMPGVTKYVIEHISKPVTFSGYEVGEAIKTGEVFNKINPDCPLYIGFMHFSQNAPWIKDNFRGSILDNSTYDETAVLYAVRKGTGIFWDKVWGICIPDEKGGNKWIEDNSSNKSYLKLKMDKEEIAALIESIMMGNF
jgi:inosine-uridine nucleoside N-ribohydrolase